MKQLFTSESVTEGHPDKICDIIADSILDAYLAQDPKARVACEVTVTTNLVNVMGEITSTAKVDIEQIVRDTIIDIGYDNDAYGFNGHTCIINNYLHEQSPDIARGVDTGGAGDQGIMFGYACSETDSLMPLPISLAHLLAEKLAYIRKNKIIDYLRPDGKVQVTVEYNDKVPTRIDTILVSAQHADHISHEQIEQDIINKLIKPYIPKHLLDDNTKYLINPTGLFTIGGPYGDTGLTGRKITIDTYGGRAHHGGGSFSGKDPTKIDRSGAYMARYIAKNIVANNIAKECEIQISYAIGRKEPLSVYVNTFNTSKYSDEDIATMVKQSFDLTPQGIIKTLQLDRSQYKKTACYGHFGKKEYAWEKIDAKLSSF